MHDKCAPYWAIALIVLMAAGLSTIRLKAGIFWTGYALDIAGPAWTYILIRGLFTAKADNRWTQFFTPGTSLVFVLVAAYGIETLQYFNVYDATFDPLDVVAYASLLIPVFVIDLLLEKADMTQK